MNYLLVFVTSLISSAVFSRLVRDGARRRGWVTGPTSARDIHDIPIPRLGGVAILGAFVLVLTGWEILSYALHVENYFPLLTFLGLLGPTLLIFSIGLFDDFRPLGAYHKLGLQAVAAAWLFMDGYRVARFHLIFGERPLGTALSLILTIFWVLLITNAFNLLDGLDGLAAGSALFCSLVVFVVALVGGNVLSQWVSIALAGAIVGFLRYNFNPATIFLGDCGSLVIGFLLAAVALVGSEKAPTAVAVGIPVVSFGLPILDTSLAIVRRFLNGKPLFGADDEHIHHKLLRLGFSQRKVVAVLYGVSACFALISLPLLYPKSIWLVLVVVGLGIFFGLQRLGYREVDELRRVARRTFEQKAVISNNLLLRRGAEELALAGTAQDTCRILRAAFQNSDYDGFEFSIRPEEPEEEDGLYPADDPQLTLEYGWRRHPGKQAGGWTLHMDLMSADGHPRGVFTVFRSYTIKWLRGDLDYLTREFTSALAAALLRAQRKRIPLVRFLRSAEEHHGPLTVATVYHPQSPSISNR
jgi:UDP-GlcNAc:undecaprenyl-phosphate GlcNAc-1-phosphate transferase